MTATYVDAYRRFPAVAALVAAAEQRDWDTLRTGLAGASPDGFFAVSSPITQLTGVEDWLAAVAAANPTDPIAAALLIERLMSVAWERRTAQRAGNVTPQQFAAFHELLTEVEARERDAITRRREDPLIWTCRITSGMGLGVGLSEITRRYRRLQGMVPHCYEANRRYITALFPKWYGTYDDALAHCRAEAAAAPDGSLCRALPVLYYAEQWLMEPDDTVKQLLAKPAVHDELLAAARGSVLSPSHVAGPDTLFLHSRFAMMLGLGKWWADAWPHFRQLGPYPPTGSWDLMKDPLPTYEKFYAAAEQAAGAGEGR